MGYGDLLRALSDEVEREARGIREAASREAEHVMEESRRAAVTERDRALAAASREEAAALTRARVTAAREVERAVLAASRRQLDALQAAAVAELRRRSRALLPGLADELAALAGPGPVTFVVDPGEEAALREHLARRHPELLARSTIRVAASARGGLQLEQDGIVLDDTIAARVDKAWPGLETRAAALLLEGTSEAHDRDGTGDGAL